MSRPNVIVGHTTSEQIAFVGPFGVGKSTALRAVSDIPVINMDVASAEARSEGLHASGKVTTTIGFDYGEWQFRDGNVGLYGVPGQERFDAIWDTVLGRSSAVVLWLHGDRQDITSEAEHWLRILAARGAVGRMAVAVTRIPPTQAEVLESVRRVVVPHHPLAPVMTADPRERMQVIQAILMALGTPPPPTRDA